jgi:hypothetical protein
MFFSGMTLPEYRVGDNTFAGRPIADVYDLSGMEIRVKVGEADRGNVTPARRRRSNRTRCRACRSRRR